MVGLCWWDRLEGLCLWIEWSLVPGCPCGGWSLCQTHLVPDPTWPFVRVGRTITHPVTVFVTDSARTRRLASDRGLAGGAPRVSSVWRILLWPVLGSWLHWGCECGSCLHGRCKSRAGLDIGSHLVRLHQFSLLPCCGLNYWVYQPHCLWQPLNASLQLIIIECPLCSLAKCWILLQSQVESQILVL